MVEKEMSLREWCNELPSVHRANKELNIIIESVKLLNSMVLSGEDHSEHSKLLVEKAISFF